MHNLTDKIVARLYQGGVNFSRNRNFAAYEDPHVQRAARIYRHLKSLEADLVAFGEPANVEVLEAAPESFEPHCVRITIDALECRRTAYISHFELALLRRNPKVRGLLGTAPAQ